MYNDYGADRYVPMAINLWQDMNSVVKAYARTYTFPFFRDGGTVWNVYNINGYIPLNYVIDTAGIVLYGATGFNEAVVRAYIESSLPPTAIGDRPAGKLIASFGATPNPAKGPVTIRYSLSRPADVTLRIYSGSGKLVASHQSDAGAGSWLWNLQDDNGAPVTNGLYFCKLAGGNATEHVKISVVR
jgi:hypothetical protein